jgi:CRP/FNR family transcriptional regulator, anaerobic regulatory protein
MTAALPRRIEVHATRPAAPVVNLIALDRLKCERHRLRRGETLVCAGDKFHALYVIRRGVLKTFATSADGLIHVTGFPMAGEMVGLNGIGTGVHRNHVVALEDADLFALPFPRVEQWVQQFSHAQALMMRTLAHEILRSQDLMFMLGAMRAEQRLALFLLDLSRRYERMGMSRSRFILRMTRQDIGSHLGLQLETVSRSLSRMHCAGHIQVQGKSIALLDFAALWHLSGASPNNQRAALDPIIDCDGCFRIAVDARDGVDNLQWQ